MSRITGVPLKALYESLRERLDESEATHATHWDCGKCGKPKHRSEFLPRTPSTRGPNTWCQSCRVAHEKTHGAPATLKRRIDQAQRTKRTYRKSGRSRVSQVVVNGHKACSNCRENKPVSEFHKNRRMKSGLQAWCRGCQKAFAAERKAG